MMQQVFIFGSSSAYGVAGTKGWGDLLKQYLHKKMFGIDGVGEKFEVFNFGKSGATIDFIQSTYLDILKNYRRDGKVIVLINVGGNNAKAEDSPDNYVSSPEEYEQALKSLLSEMKERVDELIFVGSGCIDESKTYPKLSPLTGRNSYFSNNRKKLFNKMTKKICDSFGIQYISVNVTDEEWLNNYIYQDGLHPNDVGYKHIFDNIRSYLKDLLEGLD